MQRRIMIKRDRELEHKIFLHGKVRYFQNNYLFLKMGLFQKKIHLLYTGSLDVELGACVSTFPLIRHSVMTITSRVTSVRLYFVIIIDSMNRIWICIHTLAQSTSGTGSKTYILIGLQFLHFLHYINHKTKQQVKGNTLYLVGTSISPNLNYLLEVRLAASTAIPFNTSKRK